MITFLYWIAIFIFAFAALSLWKLNQYDEDELPLSKDAAYQVIIVLLLVGATIFAVVMPFKNYQIQQEQQSYHRTFAK